MAMAHILLAEDDESLRRFLAAALVKAGHTVTDFGDGDEAFNCLQGFRFDLLLTDIVMPGGLDGVDLARIAIERWPKLKVVLTSGFPEARIEVDSEMLRSLRLLSKPYSRVELATVLRSALES